MLLQDISQIDPLPRHPVRNHRDRDQEPNPVHGLVGKPELVIALEHTPSSPIGPRNGLVADDSSAQPLNRTDRGIVDSPSRLESAVPRFLMVANTTGSARLQIPAGRPIRLVRKVTLRCSNGTSGRRTDNMPSQEMDQLAAEAMECWADFQEGLSSDKRKYPVQQFRAFWAVTKRYAELTRSDPLIHRSVAGAVNELLDFLEVERKRVPGDVLRDAERLECLLFSRYDPHFEGDEPPGL
jgi:hypothetical protein